MTPNWQVELHCHTERSKDSLVKPEQIIRICGERGIDKIAITDHNTADGAIAMHKQLPDLVIVGEEIMTTYGEILGYFMQETIPAGLSPEETIRRLRDQGAAISVSHPFDRFRKGAWQEADLLRIIDKVDAIEIFNARCLLPQDNAKAVAFAKQHHVLGTAGSDAHTRYEYGRGMVRVEPFEDAASFLNVLRHAEYITRLSPFYVHFGSTYAKRLKKWRQR